MIYNHKYSKKTKRPRMEINIFKQQSKNEKCPKNGVKEKAAIHTNKLNCFYNPRACQKEKSHMY